MVNVNMDNCNDHHESEDHDGECHDEDDDDVGGGDDGGEELGNGDGLDRHHITNQLRRVLKTFSSSPQQSIASTRARD